MGKTLRMPICYNEGKINWMRNNYHDVITQQWLCVITNKNYQNPGLGPGGEVSRRCCGAWTEGVKISLRRRVVKRCCFHEFKVKTWLICCRGFSAKKTKKSVFNVLVLYGTAREFTKFSKKRVFRYCFAHVITLIYYYYGFTLLGYR